MRRNLKKENLEGVGDGAREERKKLIMRSKPLTRHFERQRTRECSDRWDFPDKSGRILLSMASPNISFRADIHAIWLKGTPFRGCLLPKKTKKNKKEGEPLMPQSHGTCYLGIRPGIREGENNLSNKRK